MWSGSGVTETRILGFGTNVPACGRIVGTLSSTGAKITLIDPRLVEHDKNAYFKCTAFKITSEAPTENPHDGPKSAIDVVRGMGDTLLLGAAFNCPDFRSSDCVSTNAQDKTTRLTKEGLASIEIWSAEESLVNARLTRSCCPGGVKAQPTPPTQPRGGGNAEGGYR